MSSDQAGYERHQGARYKHAFGYRSRDQLPYSLAAVSAEAVLMLDATVYVDGQAGRLPADLSARLASSQVLHCAVALGEIAASLGLLDPDHPGTEAISQVLLETLRQVDDTRTVAPSTSAWLEASVMTGVLARTQHLGKETRRKLLNDALLFLAASESGAVLISRNARDMDLLSQMRPDVQVCLYDRRPA